MLLNQNRHDAYRAGCRDKRQLFHEQPWQRPLRPAPQRPAVQQQQNKGNRNEHRLGEQTHHKQEKRPAISACIDPPAFNNFIIFGCSRGRQPEFLGLVLFSFTAEFGIDQKASAKKTIHSTHPCVRKPTRRIPLAAGEDPKRIAHQKTRPNSLRPADE